MAQGTFRSVSVASSSGAPGSGRTESIWARYSSPCQTCSMATSSLDSVRPVSRSRADTNRPPLIPIRRWIRHTDRSMFSRASAVRQAITCWYTLSISVPSRSKRNAGAGGCGYSSGAVTAPVWQGWDTPLSAAYRHNPLHGADQDERAGQGRRGEVGQRRAQPDLVPDVAGARIEFVQHPGVPIRDPHRAATEHRRALRPAGAAPEDLD